MTALAKIESTLPTLSSKELRQLERAIHCVYRERNEPILYDDAYGVWTEDDQASAAAEVFMMLEDAEGDYGAS
jgi:hypothetical protein